MLVEKKQVKNQVLVKKTGKKPRTCEEKNRGKTRWGDEKSTNSGNRIGHSLLLLLGGLEFLELKRGCDKIGDMTTYSIYQESQKTLVVGFRIISGFFQQICLDLIWIYGCGENHLEFLPPSFTPVLEDSFPRRVQIGGKQTLSNHLQIEFKFSKSYRI